MSFVVEDGTGLSSANAYVSVADANTYHSDQGSSGWTGLDAVKEAAIVRATTYLDLAYKARFKGYRTHEAQSLQWPRSTVFDHDDYEVPDTSVPQGIKNAVCELALRALTEDLLPDVDDPSLVSESTVRVGPITESVKYSGNKRFFKRFTKAELWLVGLLEPANRVARG